jgi:hypothetical protein
VRCTVVGTFRILATTSLLCAHTTQHEICTCVLMLQPLVAWLPRAKLGRFYFWRLVCCRSK